MAASQIQIDEIGSDRKIDLEEFLCRHDKKPLDPRPDAAFGAYRQDDNKMVGCIHLLTAAERDGLICRFVVEPQCRGRGIGGNLYFRLVNTANSRGLESLYVYSSAVGFFLQKGFEDAELKNITPIFVEESQNMTSAELPPQWLTIPLY